MAPTIPTSAAALAMAIALAASGAAQARTLAVAASGVDSSLCGGKSGACRSIARAIVNAAPGDKIVVGPGLYGDVDGDGVLGEPGEEPAAPLSTRMILVDKPLTIESRDGAASTIIDAGGLPKYLVGIHANGVVFGKPRKGFTLQNAPSGYAGLLVSADGTGSVVAGNRALANGIGFIVFARDVLVAGNQAVGNEVGFQLSIDRIRLIGNEAIGSVNQGLLASLASEAQIVGNVFMRNGGPGAEIGPFADGVVLRGNAAGGNRGAGFVVTGDSASVVGNVASGNAGIGFFLDGKQILLAKSAALANFGPGVEISSSSEDVTVTGNSLIGNGRALGMPCGIFKLTSDAVDATGNFWGTATGPGPAPADEACDDTAAGNLGTTPFSTKEIKVKIKPPKLG